MADLRPGRASTSSGLAASERFGRIWGGIFVALVLILAVTLVGKALLAKG